MTRLEAALKDVEHMIGSDSKSIIAFSVLVGEIAELRNTLRERDGVLDALQHDNNLLQMAVEDLQEEVYDLERKLKQYE